MTATSPDPEPPPSDARQRFAPADTPPRRRDALRRLGRFLALSLHKASGDELPTRSAALAFVTTIALIPLLAALSYFSAGFFSTRQGDLVALLARILPYTEQAITDALRQFLEQSGSLRGFGLTIFFVTALGAMGVVEHIVNQIWDVTRRRTLRGRLNSFVLLLVWGPLLIGATYSGLFLLRQNRTLSHLADSLPAQVLPFAVMVVGLTMLYWQVPYTEVRFRSALVGGVCAALLLEALRYGFALYVEEVQQVSIIYGSFGLALLFMISIQAAWAIVLLGIELSYCVQNYGFLSRPRRPAAIMEGSWLGLGALVLAAGRLRRHQPLTPHLLLAEQLGLSAPELRRVLAPLVSASYLQESPGQVDGYLLACDPHHVRVEQVLELYEPAQWQVLQPFPDAPTRELEALRARFVEARGRAVDALRLVDLVGEGDGEAPTDDTDAMDDVD